MTIYFTSSKPEAVRNIHISIEPAHLAVQLPMRLKKEIFQKCMETAEGHFPGSTSGIIQFKFAKRRLPKKCRSAIEVFASWCYD